MDREPRKGVEGHERIELAERASVVRERAERAAIHELGTVTLTRTLVERVGELVRKEVELARVEAAKDVHHGMVAGGLGGAAAVMLIAALACGLIALCDALALVVPRWLAALILCVASGLIGAALGWSAFIQLRRAVPRRSIREAKATFHLFKERLA